MIKTVKMETLNLELVGRYKGRGAANLPVYKGSGKFFLDQNPSSTSLFARGRRDGHDIKWELERYPADYKTLAYTGNVLIDGRYVARNDARRILIDEQLQRIRK